MPSFAPVVDPPRLKDSGSVFASGRAAFSASTPLYLLDINPGGKEKDHVDYTVEWCHARCCCLQQRSASHTTTAPSISIRVNDRVVPPLDRITAPVSLTLTTSLPVSSTASPAQWIASAGLMG